MSGKAIAGLTGAIVVLVIGCVAALGLAGSGLAMAACAAPMTAPVAGASTRPGGGWPAVGTWSSEQVNNAATIVAVGQQLRVPPRGWVIAIATAMQESSLRNLNDLGPDNDHDSLGLFQQRPSQGWGTPAQILDPVYAATQFYNHLLQVANWQDLPLTFAAQHVQRSAYPTAYAKWEHDAYMLVNYVGPNVSGMPPADFTGWLSTCAALGGDGQPGSDSVPLPPGFTLPPTTPPRCRHRHRMGPSPTGHALCVRRRLHRRPLRYPRPPMRLLQPGPTGIPRSWNHPSPHHQRPAVRRQFSREPRRPTSRRPDLHPGQRRHDERPGTCRALHRARTAGAGAAHRGRREDQQGVGVGQPDRQDQAHCPDVAMVVVQLKDPAAQLRELGGRIGGG